MRLLGLSAARVLSALFLFTGFLNSASGAEDVRPKRVLIISMGSRLAPGFMVVDQQLLRALGEVTSQQVEINAENLDLVRFPSAGYQQIFRGYLAEKYAGHQPDLVILVFLGTLRFSGSLLSDLFPGTPIVVAGFTEEEVRADQLGTLVSGVAQRVNPRATLELIQRLQPDLRRVVVIGGTAEIDRQVLQRVKEATQSIKGQTQIDFWDNLTMAELRKAVIAVPQNTAILYARMFRDAAGQAVISSEVGQWIGRSANVPVYVMTNTSLGTGAVGGSTASAEALGKRAGELARLILTGTAPASLPFEIRTDSAPTFDWRALKRWGISESRLPPNSVVLFRPQSLWQEYHWYVVAAVILICLQGAMIIDLLLERRRRIRIQAQLKESQNIMELAASAGELGLWSRELSDEKVWLNAPMRVLFGFGKDEVVRFSDLLGRVHFHDRERMLLEVEHAEVAEAPFEGEFRVVLPDGTERWMLAKGRTVSEPTDRNQRRMGAILDVTERKRAEEHLRETEERFRTMADGAPVMIWMSGTDKLCTFFNRGWLDFRGRKLEQEVGNGWAEGVHPDDVDGCVKVYVNAFDARQNFTMEYRLRRYDGEYRWVVDHGVPRLGSDGAFLGYIGTAIDISDRKRGAEILQKEREFLRQVIDIDPNFIFAKDREGRFTLANQALAEAYGTRVENLIGKTDADFNPKQEEVEFFRHVDREVIGTSQERFIAEERMTDAQGKVRWLQTVKRPILAADGSANQVLGASTDITRRKQTELELQEQRAEIAHVARISTMGELAASLAHELNQPLTAILSNAQAALRFLSNKPAHLDEVREILQDIVKDNNRAGDVIRRMRALAKKEALEFASLDLASLIRDVVVLLHSDAILENINIVLELDDDLQSVRGDKVQLQQVVLNLMLNAFDAMKDSSTSKRSVKLRLEDNGAGFVQASVRDHGTGLSGVKLDKIFQPFYTTKGEGLGMGLSICRSIIEAHGGRLWAENNPAAGATFYFTVPIAQEAGDQKASIEPKYWAASLK